MIERIESGISAKSMGSDYLFYLRECAEHLGLCGTAFFKDDGSVKIIAEGESENLERFSEKIKHNNFLSQIENFYLKWDEPKGEFENFYVEEKE